MVIIQHEEQLDLDFNWAMTSCVDPKSFIYKVIEPMENCFGVMFDVDDGPVKGFDDAFEAGLIRGARLGKSAVYKIKILDDEDWTYYGGDGVFYMIGDKNRFVNDIIHRISKWNEELKVKEVVES